MKICIVFIVWVACLGLPCFSQDTLFVLHPAIGEIIDRNEKTNFALFPELSTSRFEYSYIRKTGDNLYLKSHLYPDSVIGRPLDTTEVNRLQNHIVKTLSLNPDLLKTGKDPDKYRSVMEKPVETVPPNNQILYPETLERISSETLSNERLKDDAENQRLWRQGSNIDNSGTVIDFSYRKKKKK